ncbi:ROK family protein [Streptomyces sp. NBC_00669]|uniref:ROK family protein n=1 Tax=Streptomyces sp. NBC_00669 TaxID=2976011 RepID=UPI002E36FBFA|nr:ROK family protein [Streptomyces sp. NBC_00669]
MQRPADIALTDHQLAELAVWAEGGAERAVRVGIVRDAAAGVSVTESARRLGVSRPTVMAWRQRYAQSGLAGLEHQPRSGRPHRIDEADAVAATLAGPPAPLREWSARALAELLGVSHTSLGKVWQRWGAHPGTPEGPLHLPARGPLSCHRPELLGVWAAGQGAAGLAVAETDRPEQLDTVQAGGEERRRRYAAMTVSLRRAQMRAEDGAVRPGTPAQLAELVRMFPGRTVHVLLWGDTADVQPLPPGVVRHTASASMGWAATVSVVAQLELRYQPHRARAALDSLAEATRVHTGAPATEPFRWFRSGSAAEAPPARATHRAFDQFTLGSFNEKLVIEAIRVSGALSRVEIAERTGLTPQAVSRITRNLLTTGLLAEDERRMASRGKPRVPLRLRPDAACAIGLHVDPEVITLVLVDLCGNVRDRRQLALPRPSAPEWCVARIGDMARAAVETVGALAENLLGVGVAAPGPLDVNAGMLLDPPLFEGWDEVPLRAWLSRELELPVLLEKDATAATVGERWLGAAESSGDFAYLYLGAGAGSGAFLNGDVFRGASGNAGEFGVMTAYAADRLTPDGDPRMVPECATMSAVVAAAAEAGLALPHTGAHAAVCAAAADGDERAAEAIRRVARVVARGAVAMTELYDIDLIVVGGPAVPPQVAELYLTEISAAVNRLPVARRVRQVRVVYSTLGDAAAAVGAAAGVFHTTFAPRLHTHSAQPGRGPSGA